MNFSGITKINNFDIEICIKHNILWFQISMHDSLFLQKLNKVYQLGKLYSDDLFGKLASCTLDLVIKGAILTNFEDKI